MNASLAEFAATVIAGVISILAVKVWRYLEERMRASAVVRLGMAAERAAGQVIAQLDMTTAPDTDAQMERIRDAALSKVAAATAVTMQHTLQRLGGTREDMRNMIVGEIGKKIAAAKLTPEAKP